MWKHKNFINLQLYAGETWVLNETVDDSADFSYDVDFVSNQVEYQQISCNIMFGIIGYLPKGATNKTVAYKGGWQNQAYRTITFATPPTGDLLTWLQANGTKQSTPQPTLTFKHFFDSGTIGSGTVKFRHYSQQEPSSGETWVLNETLPLTDKLVLRKTNAIFTSNNENFVAIRCSEGTTMGPQTLWYYTNDTDYVVACEYGAWSNQAYRTITFDEPVTDSTLLAWLQANGVKQ